MTPTKRALIGALMLGLSLPAAVSAQRYRPMLRVPPPQPRVYYAPASRISRDAYITGGAIAGGVAGTRYGGLYGGAVLGPVGGYAGAIAYDRQAHGTDYYRYPQQYGIQTTTPYMARPHGR